jgi:hypothetical protein
LMRGLFYLPWARNAPWIAPLIHSGAKPDLDYRLSNVWPLNRLSSGWYFVVTRA